MKKNNIFLGLIALVTAVVNFFATCILIRDAKRKAANRRKQERRLNYWKELEDFLKRPKATLEEVCAKGTYFQRLLDALHEAGFRTELKPLIGMDKDGKPAFPGDYTYWRLLVLFPDYRTRTQWVDGLLSEGEFYLYCEVAVDMRPMEEIVEEAAERDERPIRREFLRIELHSWKNSWKKIEETMRKQIWRNEKTATEGIAKTLATLRKLAEESNRLRSDANK